MPTKASSLLNLEHSRRFANDRCGTRASPLKRARFSWQSFLATREQPETLPPFLLFFRFPFAHPALDSSEVTFLFPICNAPFYDQGRLDTSLQFRLDLTFFLASLTIYKKKSSSLSCGRLLSKATFYTIIFAWLNPPYTFLLVLVIGSTFHFFTKDKLAISSAPLHERVVYEKFLFEAPSLLSSAAYDHRRKSRKVTSQS